METNFDFSKTYYKVMRETEYHNGFQYHDGLNVLKGSFDSNPERQYGPGRLYFTDYEHLPEFLSLGVYIREVTIPENAKLVKIKDGEWGTNKIILGEKYHIINDFDKWYDPNRFNKKIYT